MNDIINLTFIEGCLGERGFLGLIVVGRESLAVLELCVEITDAYKTRVLQYIIFSISIFEK